MPPPLQGTFTTTPHIMATAAQLHDARARGDHRRQYVQPGGRHVTVNEVLRILEIAASQSHPGVRRSANLLIRYMAEGDWRIAAGLHRGGRPDNPRPDNNWHITVTVPERGGFHLHVTSDLHLRRVTHLDDEEIDVVPPFVPPGAAPPV